MRPDAVRLRRLTQSETEAAFDDLARLRITVFREYPYLYDGDLAYERRYLDAYLRSGGAVVIGAFDGTRLVGAATAAPLSDHFEEFAGPLAGKGLDAGDYFYFGESVLEKACRGRGLGVGFFEHREAAAREQGFARTLFCAVTRPADHPARPPGYAPLDAFWRNRGYERIEGMTAHFSWKDIGADRQTEKPMEFWTRHLPR